MTLGGFFSWQELRLRRQMASAYIPRPSQFQAIEVKGAWRSRPMGAAPVCQDCHARYAVQGLTRCEPCRQLLNDRSRAARAAKVAEGRCLRCPAPALDGRTLCADCRIRQATAKSAAFRRVKPDAPVRRRFLASHKAESLSQQEAV